MGREEKRRAVFKVYDVNITFFIVYFNLFILWLNISEKREINIWTQLLGSRGSFMAGTGAKKSCNLLYGRQKRKKCGFQKDKERKKSCNLLYGRQKRKKCGIQKDKERVAKFFGLPSFWTSSVDNVKEGFLYSLRNVSAWKRHFKKDAK